MAFLLPIQMNSAAVIAACIFTFLPFLYFSYVLSCRRNTSSGNRRVPKAGSAWPLIGHLHLLGGPELPHVTLGNMADKYGPIFAIQLGTHQAIVVSTWEMAQDCLSVNEKAFSSRPKIVAMEHMGYNHAMFGFSPYGPYWREIRKISVQQLLSNHTLLKFDSVRSYEMKASLKEIYDSWVKNEQVSEKILWDMKKWFQDLVLNLALRIIVGKRREVNNEDRWLRVIREFFELLGVFTFSDAFSFLRPLDIGGYEKAMKKTGKEIDQLLQECLEEHKSNKNSGNNKDGQDFMDVMMSLLDDGRDTFNLDPDTINKATCLAMIAGSADTTSITLTWALSLLLNNRHALKKAQDELDIHVGKNRPVEESDLKNLVYLQAIFKETLRLYPPGQLLAARVSIEDCTVGGFFVPKGTRLFLNLSKIHRDPLVWPEPLEFRPERFLTTHKDVDVRGQNFELLPFGSGRRGCPGISFASQVVELALASFLHAFEISTVSNEPIDMTESFGFTNDKATALEVLLRPRLSSALRSP